jgi:hypothetical protein
MRVIEKRLATLEDRAGIGSRKMTVFINHISGETTGARLIDGRSWPRLADESLDAFERRLVDIVPHQKGGYRIIVYTGAGYDGADDFALL